MKPRRYRLTPLALLSVVIGVPVSALLSSQDGRDLRAIVEVSEVGAREVWWRVDWARIIDLDGAWAVRSDDEFTFLEPAAPGCVLRILARSSGKVFDYPMSPEGDVGLGLGWIMVSTGGPLDCASRATELALEETPKGPWRYAGFREVSFRLLERIVVHGPEPLLFLPADSNLLLRAWRRVAPGDPDNRVEVQGVLGDGYRFPSTDDAEWFTLTLMGPHDAPGSKVQLADRVAEF